MDENYINNLGMSSEVDEGLWDRLKSRASGYAQAFKNVTGKGATEMEAANFNSLFKTFLKKSIRAIEDLARVLEPHLNTNKLTPQQEAESQKIFEVHWLMKNMETLPVTEANMFTRPFSALGAQASGNVGNILSTYKKLLESYYNSFVTDAKKLNIVPADYITRRIGATYPDATTFLKKFGEAIGKPIGSGPGSTGGTTTTANSGPGSPASTATGPVPSGPTPPPTPPPAAAPAAPVPPAAKPFTWKAPFPKAPVASSPVSAPTPVSAAPVTTTAPAAPAPVAPPASSTPPVAPASPSASPTAPVHSPVPNLVAQSLDKVIKNLTPPGFNPDAPEDDKPVNTPMLKTIAGYIKRDANKAEVPFPKDPPIKWVNGDTTILWHLRYKYAKDIGGHTIQIHGEVTTNKPGEKPATKKSTNWEDLIKFSTPDVLSRKGGINPAFDVYEKISQSNPALGAELVNAKVSKDPALNKAMAQALRNIEHAAQPQSERGTRQLDVDPDQELSGGTAHGEPIEGPKTPEELKNAPPELKGRTTKTSPPVSKKVKAAAKTAKSSPKKVSAKTVEPEEQPEDMDSPPIPPATAKPDEAPVEKKPVIKKADPVAPAAEKKKPTPDEIRKAEKDRNDKLKKRIGLEERVSEDFRDFLPL
jgi:hypothetical protein